MVETSSLDGLKLAQYQGLTVYNSVIDQAPFQWIHSLFQGVQTFNCITFGLASLRAILPFYYN